MSSHRLIRLGVVVLALMAIQAVPAAAQTPLGATLVTGGVQFAVFSQFAPLVGDFHHAIVALEKANGDPGLRALVLEN